MSLTQRYALGPAQYGAYGFGRIVDDTSFVALRSIRDLNSNGVKTKFESYTAQSPHFVHSVAIDKAAAYDLSPGGCWSLSLRNVADKSGGEPKAALELEDRKQRDDCLNLNLDASDVHGKIVGDTWFGGIAWSPDGQERYVAYVAQAKGKTRKSYFEEKPDENKDTVFGGKFEYTADWGEKYVGVKSTVISILDTLTGKVRIVPGFQEGDTVGQPVWRNFVDGGGKRRYILSYTKWRKGASGGLSGQMSAEEEEVESSGELWKLGMIYCYQRPCSIHSADLTTWLESAEDGEDGEEEKAVPQHKCLTSTLTNARSPRYSPDGRHLVFIGRKERLASHNGCFAVYGMSMGSGHMDTLQGVVQDPAPYKSEVIPGFFGDQLPRNCFVSGTAGAYAFVFNTMVRSQDTPVIMVVNENDSHTGMSGSCVPLHIEGTEDGRGCVILDARDDQLLCQISSPTSPQQLIVTSLGTVTVTEGPRSTVLSSQNPTQIHFKCGKGTGGEPPRDTARSLRRALASMKWRTQTHSPAPNTTHNDISFESILISPPRQQQQQEEGASPAKANGGGGGGGGKTRAPLLLVPHGGPHGCMPTSFVPSYAYLSMALGAAVLHVNYRGSTGFGQRSIDSLCGTIGTNDVSDMMTALRDTLARYPTEFDEDRVCVVGGSHGGFLAGHLIGQHPDTFRAAALRNPVTNIPAMVGVTDIPDWCFIETLGPEVGNFDFHRHNPANAEVLSKMYAASPVAHVDRVRTPALVCLGAVDRRVPQSQGIEYHSLLKSRGVDTRMLVFPEDCHAIDQPCSEAEHFVAIAEWFKKYLE